MAWPACILDLNPVENVWDLLEHCVKKKLTTADVATTACLAADGVAEHTPG